MNQSVCYTIIPIIALKGNPFIKFNSKPIQRISDFTNI